MRNLLLFLLLLSFSSIYCQTSNRSYNLWISCGPGLFFNNTKGGISLYSSLDWSINKLIETENGSKNKSINMKFRLLNCFTVGNEDISGRRLYDLGFLCGKAFGKIMQLKISGGIGVLSDFRTITHFSNQFPYGETYEYQYYLTPNIPVELEISLIPVKYFGLGVCGFANLNFKNSLFGFNLKFSLGNMR